MSINKWEILQELLPVDRFEILKCRKVKDYWEAVAQDDEYVYYVQFTVRNTEEGSSVVLLKYDFEER
jgi:hypothetical protein